MNLKSYLTIFVIFSLITSLSFAFCGTGDGSIGNPYLICTPDDLNQTRDDLTAHYKLNNSIDMNVSPYNENEGWEPIGVDYSGRFTGSFDGDGYTISNLYYNGTSGNYIGLFGYVEGNISNVNLTNVNISSYNAFSIVGGIVGDINGGEISNCFVSGELYGQTYVGGVVGGTENYVKIYNSSFNGNVESSSYAGGLVGPATKTEINNSYSTGNVYGVDKTGGLVSRIADNTIIINCYSKSNVNGNDFVGGLVGDINFGAEGAGSVINSYSTGSITNRSSTTNIGGLIGHNDGTVTNSYYDSETSGQSDNDGRGTPKTTIEMKTLSTFSAWDIETTIVDLNDGYPYLGWQNDNETTWLIYQAEQLFCGGTGSIADPYMICTADELNNVRLDLTAHYKLKNDIDLNVSPYNESEGWLPIGNNTNKFTGSFDGDGYTINNLYINRTTFYSGLFGFINNGQISNVYVNGNIIGVASNNNLGGIVGNTLNASIINSHFTGEIITNTSSWGFIGGITGYLEDANPSSHNTFIINCSSNVNISEVGASGSANIYIGGLVGQQTTKYQTITNSYSTGKVNGTGKNVNIGGLVGSIDDYGKIENSYSTCDVFGHSSSNMYSAGLVGQISNSNVIINNSYSTGFVNTSGGQSWENYDGGLIGYDSQDGTITNSYYDSETSGQSDDIGKGEPKTTTQMKTLSTFSTWDIETTTVDLNDGYPYLGWENDNETTWLIYQAEQLFCGGTGSIADPYMICTADELNNVRLDLTAHYKLNNSIDLDVAPYNTGTGWLPIGNDTNKFTGSFDGNNYEISNLYITNKSEVDYYVGLFGYSENANFYNVGIVNVNITGTNIFVGALLGFQTNGIINNTYSNGTIDLSWTGSYVGGLIGGSEEGIIYDSHSNCSIIDCQTNGGGFIGYSFSEIYNSYSIGNVSGRYGKIGGFAGYNDGNISDSYSTGIIEGYFDDNGGFVGYNGGNIYDSYSTGNVIQGEYTGGFAGINNGEIYNSYSTSNVSGVFNSTGGFIGINNGIVNYSYSTGYVNNLTEMENMGGFIGLNSGTITNSYYDSETSGQSDNDGRGEPKTTTQMKTLSTFSTWDIETTTVDLNDGYPYLGWQNDNETTWLIYTSGIGTSYCNGNYTGGDWTVDSPITCENEVIIVEGDIVLNSVLNLKNITLILEGNFTVSGNLDVNSSFINFTINNSVFTFNPSSNVSINNSDILSKNSSTYYGFYVNDSTIFSVENSYIGYVGDYLGDGLEGIKVNAENAWFNNLSYNNFDNCLFTLLENTNNATIINSNFSSCGVDNYGSNNSIVYNEIQSLFCMNGSDNFIGFNTFKNGDIGITETYNNTFFNNVFVNAWIRDMNESMYNEFVFGDIDYGMIEWYSNNYTTGNDSNPINMSLGEKIYIEDNLIGIADISDLNNFNVSAQIIFYNLTWTNDVELYKNGVRCDNTTLCNITYYDPGTGTLYAEVSGFSNYTTNESSSEEVNVTLISPSNGDVINTTSTILNYSVNIQSNCTVYHNISGTWSSDCSTNETTGDSCSVGPLSDGEYMWNVYCVDSTNASNYAWNEINWTFTVDTIPPYVEIISPENRTYGPGEIWINITNSSDADTVWFFNGTGNETYITPKYINVPGDGTYTLDVWANDSANNVNYTNVTFTVDTIPPTISITTPYNGYVYNNRTRSLAYFVNDYETTWYNWNGTNYTYTAVIDITFNEGVNTLHIWANDSANNVNYTNLTFTIDTIPPYVEIVSPLNQTYGPGEIWINITNSSDTVSVEWYNGFIETWVLYTEPVNVSILAGDTYILLVRANDSVGNYNYTEVTFTIDATGPTFTTIPADESIVYETSWNGVTFTATDVSLIDDYFVNDTDNFIINSSGYLNVTGQLAVGIYHVNVSVNDTLGNINSTIYNLNVTTSTSSCDVLFNETSPLDYSIDFIVYTNCDTEFTLWRNGTAISNGSVQSLAAGTYNFTVIRTDDENYSNVREEETFTINKIESVVYTYLNGVRGNITISNNTEIDINGTLIEGEGTLRLYKNNTVINDGEPPLYNLTLFDVVGLYPITTRYGETENYTTSQETWYVNVTTENIEPVVELISPDEGATITTATYVFKFNVSAVNDISICKLVIDDSVIDTLTDVEKNVEQNISYNGLSNGEYAWYINCTDVIGTEVQSTEERNFTVNIPVAPSSGSSSSSRNKEDPKFEYEWDCETGLLEIETEERIEVRLMSLRDYSTYKEESDKNGLVSFELPIDGTFRIFTESTSEFNPLQMDISLDFCEVEIPDDDEDEIIIPEVNETEDKNETEVIIPEVNITEIEDLIELVENEIQDAIDENKDVSEAQEKLNQAKIEFKNGNYALAEQLLNEALTLILNAEAQQPVIDDEPLEGNVTEPDEDEEEIAKEFDWLPYIAGIIVLLILIWFGYKYIKK